MRIESPFSDEQVKKISKYQYCGWTHPFTCPDDNEILQATNGGMVCPNCKYTQSWVHDYMEQKLPKDPIKNFLKKIKIKNIINNL